MAMLAYDDIGIARVGESLSGAFAPLPRHAPLAW
jgi:hypothetical protein